AGQRKWQKRTESHLHFRKAKSFILPTTYHHDSIYGGIRYRARRIVRFYLVSVFLMLFGWCRSSNQSRFEGTTNELHGGQRWRGWRCHGDRHSDLWCRKKLRLYGGNGRYNKRQSDLWL